MPADTKIIELRQFLAERLPRARLGVAPERMVPATLPTGIESIDQGLGGGLPQGAFTELVAPGEGSGSAQFIHALLRHTASGGRFLTLVDGADSLDIDALEPEALAHLLWVRCRNTAEALQTTDLLLYNGWPWHDHLVVRDTSLLTNCIDKTTLRFRCHLATEIYEKIDLSYFHH